MHQPVAKIKILLVEDNVNLSENVRDILVIHGYEISTILEEAESACSQIEDIRPDIVLLDIKLKGRKTGIDLAEELRRSMNVPIVFLTSYSGADVVKKVKHVRPDGFITKPFTTETLVTTIELAIENFNLKPNQVNNIESPGHKDSSELFIRENGWLKKIMIADIEWIKAEGSYTHVFVAGKQHTLRNTVKELMEKLPEEQFSRVHKSYIVNLKKVDALSASAVKLGESEIPIGRNFYQSLLKNINKLSN